jgi:UDP-N-acetylglucosamine 4,6-dehydratase
LDLADVVASNCKHEYIGIRPGEKLAELLVSADEAPWTIEMADRYIIMPMNPSWPMPRHEGAAVAANWQYSSLTNDKWLSRKEMEVLLDA